MALALKRRTTAAQYGEQMWFVEHDAEDLRNSLWRGHTFAVADNGFYFLPIGVKQIVKNRIQNSIGRGKVDVDCGPDDVHGRGDITDGDFFKTSSCK